VRAKNFFTRWENLLSKYSFTQAFYLSLSLGHLSGVLFMGALFSFFGGVGQGMPVLHDAMIEDWLRLHSVCGASAHGN
jgi:hypothetical protein